MNSPPRWTRRKGGLSLQRSKASVSSVSSVVAMFLALTLGASAATDTRLIQAVKQRDAAAVRTLLKQRAPAVDVNAVQGDGSTALHWAAHRDDLTIADLLIRSGARPNAVNDLGVTPLHLACTNRSAPMVERLLAAGAKANAALRNGET